MVAVIVDLRQHLPGERRHDGLAAVACLGVREHRSSIRFSLDVLALRHELIEGLTIGALDPWFIVSRGEQGCRNQERNEQTADHYCESGRLFNCFSRSRDCASRSPCNAIARSSSVSVLAMALSRNRAFAR